MAEALYPKEPPPSYDSQFHYPSDLCTAMNTSPTPSAPPQYPPPTRSHHQSSPPQYPAPPTRSHHQSNTASPICIPLVTPHRTYKKVSVSAPKEPSTPEKAHLSKPAATHRVPKRAPPPPPPSLFNRSISYPASNSTRRSRPQSSIQFSQYQDTQGLQFHATPQNTHPAHDLSCSGLSSSATNIHEEFALDAEQELQPRRSHMVTFEQPRHVYESLHPRSPPREDTGERLRSEEPVEHTRSYFTRQSSAPSAMRQYHRVALPPYIPRGGLGNRRSLNVGGPVETPYNPSHQFTQPSLRDIAQSASFHTQLVSPGSHAIVQGQRLLEQPLQTAQTHLHQPPTVIPQSQALEVFSGRPPHLTDQQFRASVQPSQPDTVNPQALEQQQLIHPSQPPTLNPQPQALEVVSGRPPQQQFQASVQPSQPATVNPQPQFATRPQPKPRPHNLTTDQVVPAQSAMQVIQASPLSQQKIQQQFSTAQNIATFPGQTQLQTYSFAQQSSIFNMMQNPAVSALQHSPPLFAIPPAFPATFPTTPATFPANPATFPATPPTYPPAHLNIPVLPQEQRTIPHEDKHREKEVPSQSPAATRCRSHSEPHAPRLEQSPASSPARRPIPKPRKPKRQTSEAGLISGSAAVLESSGILQPPTLGDAGNSTAPESVESQNLILESEISGVLDYTRPPSQSEEGECVLRELAESCSIPQSDSEEGNAQAPAKPPRRHIRKPAPPPPTSRPNNPQNSPSHVESAIPSPPDVAIQPKASGGTAATARGIEPVATGSVQQATPSGYKLRDVFFNGNIVFFLPLSDPLRLPLRAAGSSLKGKGTFKNDCKFEIVFLSAAIGHEQSVLIVMLKCFSRVNHYLAINRKGKVQMTKGAAEKCKFVVREVMDRPLLRYGVVTLESAIRPGWFVSVASSGKSRRCKEPGLPARVDESRFAIRVERIFNPYSSPLMNFDHLSVMHHLHDRCVIQLLSKASSKLLCVNLKGKLLTTGNSGEVTTHFMVFDRGMGVVSLRSNKFPRIWLRVKQSKIQGNGKPDLAADFRVMESPDGAVQFESIVSPGIYLTFPSEQAPTDPQANRDFTIRNVAK